MKTLLKRNCSIMISMTIYLLMTQKHIEKYIRCHSQSPPQQNMYYLTFRQSVILERGLQCIVVVVYGYNKSTPNCANHQTGAIKMRFQLYFLCIIKEGLPNGSIVQFSYRYTHRVIISICITLKILRIVNLHKLTVFE